MGQALKSVFGTEGPIDDYAMPGKTDPQIMKELMQLAGLPAAEIENMLSKCCMNYIDVLCNSISNFHLYAYPGVLKLLETLSRSKGPILGLLTGNLEGVAGPKLRAAGIPFDVFALGAYGSDDSDRNHLPSLAICKAKKLLNEPVNPNSVLIIGDTPYDIACARYAGTLVMAVATGDYSRAELAIHKPDYLFYDLTDLHSILEVILG
jgi:phosphoglycolate phosphatase